MSVHYDSAQMQESVSLLQDQKEDKTYQTYDLEVCGPDGNFDKENVPLLPHRHGSTSLESPDDLSVSKETDSASAVRRYIYDLKLPFELLVMTIMFVKLRECSPIFAKLLPGVLQSHPHFILESGVMVLLTLVVLWCLLSSSNMRHGHIGIWTGRLGGRF